MTTSNGTLNARTARKSLADQIDRLDGILDGLAEALNESIADAVKGVIAQAVRSAVETAVKEVLSSPDLLRAALEKHARSAAFVRGRSGLSDLRGGCRPSAARSTP